MNGNTMQTILVAALVALVVSGLTVLFMNGSPATAGTTDATPSEEERITDFYLTEAAVHVSPHSIRKDIMKGETDFILVDLRSEEEYLEEHIVGAVNIPAYTDKDHSDYGAVQRITASFRTLREQNPDKDIIVYCYSIPCMTGRKVGAILSEEGIYVKHLGVGWNEWRYFWQLWNHPHEWNITDPTEYTASGPDPGVFTGRNYLEDGESGGVCPIEGGLGC
jgi:rhodanese-related sulfurtransferase